MTSIVSPQANLRTTTNYLYDGDSVIETADHNGSVLAKFAQGQNIDEPLAESVSGAAYDYEQDGLGSATSLTNSSGALSLSYTYDSFGKVTASSGSVTNPFRYTGRDFDSETGLYYYRARYYDQTTGRFLNEDPIRFIGGDDFYLYSDNSPVTLVDPYGSQSSTWSGVKDLWQWFWGFPGTNSHSNDNVTRDLSNSPAWKDILNKFKKNSCAPGRYCGQFEFKQVFNPHNFNIVIQSVGSFCADISSDGNNFQVDAFNDWGFQSFTRIPNTNYFNPTLQDMLFRRGTKWAIPSSILNNTQWGPMRVQRFWYHWKEKNPCCSN